MLREYFSEKIYCYIHNILPRLNTSVVNFLIYFSKMPAIEDIFEASDSDMDASDHLPRSTSGLISHFESKSNASQPEKIPENELKEVQTKIQMTHDKIPINNHYALAKETSLLKFYYGAPDISAGDFIDSEVLSLLDSQLLRPGITMDETKTHVLKYLANYTNWAAFAVYHSTKAVNKVILKILNDIFMTSL